MMLMEPYDVYRYYLALKLHFTTDNYDVIKNKGRVRASKQAFFKRKDLFAIKKIANTYADKDIVDFLVANFVSGDKWGGVFDTDSKTRYLEWKKKIESLSYNFTNEIKTIEMFCTAKNISFTELFVSNKSQHPGIVKLYLSKLISIETLTILDVIENFSNQLDIQLKDDIVWPDVSRTIKKYRPFLQFDKVKFTNIVNSLNKEFNVS